MQKVSCPEQLRNLPEIRLRTESTAEKEVVSNRSREQALAIIDFVKIEHNVADWQAK